MTQTKGSRYPTASDGAARSVVGPSEGFQDVVVAGDGDLDLENFSGKYVYIEAIGGEIDIAFTNATGNAIRSTDALTKQDRVPRRVPDGAGKGIYLVVPAGGYHILRYEPVTTGGSLTVTRS